MVFTEDVEAPQTVAGVAAIRALGREHRFSVQVTDEPEKFEPHQLGKFRAVIFLNSDGAVLNDTQKAAFEEYYTDGGGFVGIGSAVEMEPEWEFYTDLIGTRAGGLTDVQEGTVKVADRVHDASKNLPEYWTRSDAWYNFESNVRGRSHVLATVVELVDELGAFDVDRLIAGARPHVLRFVVSLAERGTHVRSRGHELDVALRQRVVDHPVQPVVQPGAADLQADRIATERVDDLLVVEARDELSLALQGPALVDAQHGVALVAHPVECVLAPAQRDAQHARRSLAVQAVHPFLGLAEGDLR